MKVHLHARHLLVGALLMAFPVSSAVPAAQAGVLVDTAVGCDSYRFELPFERWGDPLEYVLVPDGTFERRARGWQRTAGARLVYDNETYYVHRRGERLSLWLRHNSAATSPAMCVQASVVNPALYPTIRFFARNLGAANSTLKVEVLFEDLNGAVQVAPIAILTGSQQWEPTVPILVVANLLPNLGDPLSGQSAVAFRFSLEGGGGDWRIDDVYVDPYRSR